MAEESKIGQLNGKWAILFKAQLTLGAVLFPGVMAWCTWMTIQTFDVKADMQAFQAVGPRYTSTQAEVDHLKQKQEVLAEIAKATPPQWLRDELASMSRRLTTIEEDVAEIRQAQMKD